MSVVESTHEQSLVTEASVVFFPMNMLKAVLYSWLSLVTGEWICPLTAMIHILWWYASSNFLLLLNKYRMIEKNTVLGIKKRGGISSVYSNRHLVDCSDVQKYFTRRSFDLGGGELCDKLQRNSWFILNLSKIT